MSKAKYIILLGDGMADFPVDSLGGRTPLQAANTPNMDQVARQGIAGMFTPIINGLPAGSDVGNLSCFGYDPRETYTGRAPIEAASRGIPLGPLDIAFRCNLVTLSDDESMQSFTAGHISSEEGAAIIETLNERFSQYPITFHNGVGYRHLGILTTDKGAIDAFDSVACTPPHNIAEQPVADYLPSGPQSGLIREMMAASREVLRDHPVNVARLSAGKLPATSIWLWGQGRTPTLKTYADLYGLTGTVVSAVDIVKGVGTLAGLDVPMVPGATGYLDTDYEAKVRAAIEPLTKRDFAYIHIEAPDETAHEGRADLKVQAIEDFDARVVGPALAYLDANPATRILVCPDHITSIASKAHEDGAVPFALCGHGVTANAVNCYTETDAAAGPLADPGFELVRRFLTVGAISETTLQA